MNTPSDLITPYGQPSSAHKQQDVGQCLAGFSGFCGMLTTIAADCPRVAGEEEHFHDIADVFKPFDRAIVLETTNEDIFDPVSVFGETEHESYPVPKSRSNEQGTVSRLSGIKATKSFAETIAPFYVPHNHSSTYPPPCIHHAQVPLLSPLEPRRRTQSKNLYTRGCQLRRGTPILGSL